MQKLILNSIVVVLVVLPGLAAAGANGRLAYRRMLALLAGGIFVFALLLMFVFPRFAGT